MDKLSQSPVYAGVVSLAVGGFAYTYLVPVGVKVPNGVSLALTAPDVWPYVLSVLMLGIGLVLFGKALFGKHRAAPLREGNQSEISPLSTDSKIKATDLRKFVAPTILMLLLIPYYVTIDYMGITPASMLLLVTAQILAGSRRWVMIPVISVLTPMVLHLFFVYVANVPLPQGLLFY